MNKKEQRLQEWHVRVADYRASGLTMAAWCQSNHYSKETLKYWLRKTNASPSASQESPPRFVPLRVSHASAPPALIVQVGQAKIEVHAGFDAQFLREVVQALEMTSC